MTTPDAPLPPATSVVDPNPEPPPPAPVLAVGVAGVLTPDDPLPPFIDAANMCYLVSHTDTTGSRGDGTNLTSDANIPFTDSIRGINRPGKWDLGADQVRRIQIGYAGN